MNPVSEKPGTIHYGFILHFGKPLVGFLLGDESSQFVALNVSNWNVANPLFCEALTSLSHLSQQVRIVV